MLYVFRLTIPANTPSSAPVELKCKLSPGTLTKCGIGFPPGCAALARVQIFRNSQMIYPSNPDESIAWDGFVWEWEDNLRLEKNDDTLTVRGWNLDDTYDHTIDISFAVLPPETWKSPPSSLQVLSVPGWLEEE